MVFWDHMLLMLLVKKGHKVTIFDKKKSKWIKSGQKRRGHDYFKPFATEQSSFFLCSSYDLVNIKNKKTAAEIDLDRVETKSVINDRPDFSEYREPKLAEALWCARRGKKGLEDPE